MKEDHMTDIILVERCQNGDMAAMDALIQNHQIRAYKFAYRLTRDQDEAADVVAEAFVRLYRSMNTFKRQSSFSTWMFRCIANCFFDLRKKSSRIPVLNLEWAQLGRHTALERLAEIQVNHSPHHSLEFKERNRSIELGLAALPDFQQAILILYHVEMFSYEEISETLGLPIGTVKSRLCRARSSLRLELLPDRSLFSAEPAMTI